MPQTKSNTAPQDLGGPLPYTTIDAASVVASMRQSGYTEAPADWIIRAELSALIARCELQHWSLARLCERWQIGRGRAYRLMADLAGPDRKRTATGPLTDRERTALLQQFPALARRIGPLPDRDRTATGPRARSSIETETETETEIPSARKRARLEKASTDPRVVRVYEHWRSYHPRSRKLGEKPAGMVRARMDGDGATEEDCLLVVDWIHLGPRREWWAGKNDHGHVYNGLSTLFKADKWDQRVESAGRWHDAGRPTVNGATPKPASALDLIAKLRAEEGAAGSLFDHPAEDETWKH